MYDPNYQYNEDDDDGQMDSAMDDGDAEGWGSEFYDDEQDDDDDTAWKVRKSAIKIIDAIIISCPVQLKQVWSNYVQLLSQRFNERDENVKVDLLEVFQNLLKASTKVEEDVSTSNIQDLKMMRKASSFKHGDINE